MPNHVTVTGQPATHTDVLMARLTDVVSVLLQPGPAAPDHTLGSAMCALHSARTGLLQDLLCMDRCPPVDQPDGLAQARLAELAELADCLMPRTVGWPPPVAYFLRLEGHLHAAVFLLRHEAAYRPPQAQARERVLALINHLTAELTDRVLDSDRQQVGGR